jgi:hypothetical protein
MRHFIEVLQALDTTTAFVVVCSAMMTLVAVMPWLRLKVLRLDVSRSVNDGASDALKGVAGFMVFVVAFSLVQVQSQFRTTEAIALKEASFVHSLDRSLFHFGTPASLAARADLQAFVTSVIEDEWPLLATNQRSAKTDALFKKFEADVRLLEAETNRQRATEAEMLRSLDGMEDMRELRIAAVELGLPPLYWWVVTGLFGIVLVLAFFTSATIDKTLANCGMICAIGMMLTLVLVYEDPFAGDLTVAPSALRRVLALMTER